VISVSYPDGYLVSYEYHPRSGLLQAVTGISDFTSYAELGGYDPIGKIGHIHFGNGTDSTYEYDEKSTRLLSAMTSAPDLNDVKAYRYTFAGDIKGIAHVKGSNITTYHYSYDKLDRLISESDNGPSGFDNAGIIKAYNDEAPVHAVKSVNVNGIDYPYAYRGIPGTPYLIHEAFKPNLRETAPCDP